MADWWLVSQREAAGHEPQTQQPPISPLHIRLMLLWDRVAKMFGGDDYADDGRGGEDLKSVNPQCSSHQIRDSLSSIAQLHGVEIRTNTRVKRILLDESPSWDPTTTASSSRSGGSGGSSSGGDGGDGGGSSGGGGGSSARVVGVELEGGEELLADAVVTNADVAASLGLVEPSKAGVAWQQHEHAQRRQRQLEAAEYR